MAEGWKKGTIFDDEAMARVKRDYNESQLKEYIDAGGESISGFIKWLKGLVGDKKKGQKKDTGTQIYEAKKGGQVKSKGYSRGGQFKGTF
jgi:hypothetical protein